MVERVGQPLGRYFGSAKYDLVIMKKKFNLLLKNHSTKKAETYVEHPLVV